VRSRQVRGLKQPEPARCLNAPFRCRGYGVKPTPSFGLLSVEAGGTARVTTITSGGFEFVSSKGAGISATLAGRSPVNFCRELDDRFHESCQLS
jgi:autotransporter passenger strand-loop-strand repeat protein